MRVTRVILKLFVRNKNSRRIEKIRRCTRLRYQLMKNLFPNEDSKVWFGSEKTPGI